MLGVGNFITGFFGGQGGCSEIGLTLINLGSGGKTRVSGVTSALITLLIIMVAYPLINAVPMAGLTGVMFVVCIHCFDFESVPKVVAALMSKQLRNRWNMHHKVNRMDAAVIVVVTIVTPFTDLAIAVFIGCIMAMIGFAWESADRLRVDVSTDTDAVSGVPGKVCSVHGALYFASTDPFLSHFDVANDPAIVEIRMEEADVCDYSAMQCLNTLGDDYKKHGKSLRLRKLKSSSMRVLSKGNIVMNTFWAKGARTQSDNFLANDDTGAPAEDAVIELGGADQMNIVNARQFGNSGAAPENKEITPRTASSFL